MRLSDKVTDVDANRAVDLVEFYLRKIAGSDDGGFDIDKIATGISSKDRNRLDVIRDILREFGDEGLTIEELIQHGSNQGLSEPDVTRAVRNLNDGGEIFRSSTGLYKMA